MRCLIVLLFLGLIGVPTLRAFDNVACDLPSQVRDAQTVAIGRVVQLTEVNAPDGMGDGLPHVVIATLMVRHLLKGTPAPQFQVVVRDEDTDQLKIGKDVLVCLQDCDANPIETPAPWLMGRGFRQTFGHFRGPHPILAVENEVITVSDEAKGKYFTKEIGSQIDVATLKELIPLILGPIMTITAPPELLPWNQPWSLRIRISNPSTFPIPLFTCTGDEPAALGEVDFVDQHGFWVGSAIGPLRLTGDEVDKPMVIVPAGGIVDGFITITKPLIELHGDPRTIRRLFITHRPQASSAGLSTGWDGVLAARVDIGFAQVPNAEAHELARSSTTLQARLRQEHRAQDGPMTDPTLVMDVHGDRFIPDDRGGYSIEDHSASELRALIDALQIERDGVVIHPAKHQPELTALINRALAQHRRIQVTLAVSGLPEMTRPGLYRVRLLVDHAGEQALSSTVEITTP